MNSYQLLSELYRILGELDRETVNEALELGPSPQITPVLKALRRATAKHQQPTATPARPLNSVRPSATFDLAEIINRIDSPNAELVKVLSSFGLRVKFNAGDSRARIARRAQKVLASLPPDKRHNVMTALMDAFGMETAGWLEVIRTS